MINLITCDNRTYSQIFGEVIMLIGAIPLIVVLLFTVAIVLYRCYKKKQAS